MSNKKLIQWIPALVIGIIAILLCWRVIQLAPIPLHDWDESIYARVAWEIAHSKPFSLAMTYNGATWLEKPPLVIYIMATLMSVGLSSELWLRGASLLFGIPLLAVIYLLAKKILTQTAPHSSKLSAFETVLLPLLAVFTLLCSPIFIDRLTLVNYDIPLALGWALFFLADTVGVQAVGLFVAVTSKSLLGFFPLLFELFRPELFKSLSPKKVGFYLLLLAIPLVWHIIAFAVYGQVFIQQHIIDHLLSRVTTPIELHFGGKMFYVKEIFLEYGWMCLIFAVGYIAWVIDCAQGMLTTKKLPRYGLAVLAFPLVFVAFLTFSKTKIYWYLLAVYPFLSLIVVYAAGRIPNRVVRLVFFTIITLYFLFKFLPETALYTPGKQIPDKTQLAQCISKTPATTVNFLVNEDERKIKHLFEAANVGIGSSFIYGGSPAFVYHSQKHVQFYYDVVAFTTAATKTTNDTINVFSKNDTEATHLDQKPILCKFGDWTAVK